MLTKEENDLLTQVGPGTPCGQMLRSYWQPAALSEELPAGGPPIPLRLFGEDLVMFRTEGDRGQGTGDRGHDGKLSTQHPALSTDIGLIGMHCSHRGTDLSYGRLEDGGLRCIYHGWLYDFAGNCLETPGEPAGSRLKDYVRHTAYPCREKGGVIFTYMGSAEPPLLPNYEVLSAVPENRLATKHFQECNYLQALEGNMDSVHIRFLHKSFKTREGEAAQAEHRKDTVTEMPSERGPDPEPPANGYYGPVRTEETDFGIWAYYDRTDLTAGPDLIFPSLCLTGGGPQARGDGYMLYWRVPIDDTHHWLFALSFKRSGPIKEEHRYARTWFLMTPDYHFIRNQRNRYLQDREAQHTTNFTGMGPVFVVQDSVANETQGPIQDRTQELLGVEDISIVAARKMMMKAIQTVQEGGDPPGVIRDPRVNQVDPLLLKRNVPPSDAELAGIVSETGGRWVAAVAGV